ncbi:MAG TPA: flagellar biosynthetic protein FliO [Bryobacteraceae bacterium]|nr:flagellar biosynthetic protein FliO [Bryobacteraceae bacterium]
MELTQQILMILVVFALLGGLLWLLRRRGALAFASRRTGTRRMELVERLPLTPHHALHLVRVSGKVVLIGTAPSACTLLDHAGAEALAPQEFLHSGQ